MKYGLYTVFDRVAGINGIMVLNNDEMAKRTFKETLFDRKKDQFGNIILNQMQRSPADYVLVKLGEMETTTGEIEPKYEELLEAYDELKDYDLSKN